MIDAVLIIVRIINPIGIQLQQDEIVRFLFLDSFDQNLFNSFSIHERKNFT